MKRAEKIRAEHQPFPMGLVDSMVDEYSQGRGSWHLVPVQEIQSWVRCT